MNRFFCKSKIHHATVTDANLNYRGSITVSEDIMRAAELIPYEKVQVLNVNNGERFETYVIAGDKNKGIICINGAAARLAQKGDKVIVISYCMLEESEIENFVPKIIFLDENNKIILDSENNSDSKKLSVIC